MSDRIHHPPRPNLVAERDDLAERVEQLEAVRDNELKMLSRDWLLVDAQLHAMEAYLSILNLRIEAADGVAHV